MMQEVVAAAGKAKDQNPKENGTAVQDFHLVNTAKIGPEAIPRPTNTASTGIFGQILTAVIVLTAAGPISIPIVARYCGGKGPANNRCKIRISNSAHPPRPIPQTRYPNPGNPIAVSAAPPTKPPGTIGK